MAGTTTTLEHCTRKRAKNASYKSKFTFEFKDDAKARVADVSVTTGLQNGGDTIRISLVQFPETTALNIKFGEITVPAADISIMNSIKSAKGENLLDMTVSVVTPVASAITNEVVVKIQPFDNYDRCIKDCLFPFHVCRPRTCVLCRRSVLC
jgi:hypothetical protein